jgi:hypothetical protein
LWAIQELRAVVGVVPALMSNDLGYPCCSVFSKFGFLRRRPLIFDFPLTIEDLLFKRIEWFEL